MRKYSASISLLLIFFNIAFYQFSFASDPEDSVAVKFSETITVEDLSRHLHVLASDEYEGRETGRKGQKMAAEYIASFYENLGLPPVLDGSYYQEFPLLVQYPEGVAITGNKNPYAFMKDFYFFRGFNDTLIEAKEILFLGYGIGHKKYNDYKKADVSGKIVMVLDKEPMNKKGKSYVTGKEDEFSDWSENWRKKLMTATEEKAAALLIVVDDMEANLEKYGHRAESPSMKLDNGEQSKSKFVPYFYISKKMANELLNSKKWTVESLKQKIDEKGKPWNTTFPTDLQLNIERKTEKLLAENVLGYVEGTDLKEELIVITAHYDHLGIKDDVVYNGADDDGSGTVAVLEVAEAFALAKERGFGPRRSILFMPVAGEEKGLLGSEYYTSNPVFPLGNTVANLNIDMIGRLDDRHEGNPDYVYLIGADRLSTELHQVSELANSTYVNLELDYTYNDPEDPNMFYYRSDHYNFAKNNVPIIFYFNGTHEDYHKSTDTIDKIHFPKMEKITRLVFFTAWELANREERIKLIED